MTGSNKNVFTPFLEALRQMFVAVGAEAPYAPLRQKAWNQFLERGLPDKKQDAFRYFPLTALYKESFVSALPKLTPTASLESLTYSDSRASTLVFVNGEFSSELSNLSGLPPSVIVLPLSKAYSTYSAFLQNRWNQSLKEEDAFALANLALHRPGAFIFIPPGVKLENPLHVLYLMQGEEAKKIQAFSRLHAFIGARAEVDFLFSTNYLSQETFCAHHLIDFALDEGAICRSMHLSTHLQEGWHFEAIRATLKRNSQLRTVSATRGGKALRQDYRVALMGENADASLHGVWMLDKNRQAHTHVLMEHQAPHCQSLQLFKGALENHSQSSFEGKIYVHKEAQKTNAYQLNHNLLLGEHAIANSKPNLEIFADDVKASHGATVSQLKPDELFYLKTRGLSTQEAKRLLVEGFCKEIIDHFTYDPVSEELYQLLKEYLYAEAAHAPL